MFKGLDFRSLEEELEDASKRNISFEKFLMGFVTAVIYIDLDPTATSAPNVIFNDFNNDFKQIMVTTSNQLSGFLLCSLSMTEIWKVCAQSLLDKFKDFDFVSSSETLLQLLFINLDDPPLNMIVTVPNCGISNSSTADFYFTLCSNSRSFFKCLPPPMLIFNLETKFENKIISPDCQLTFELEAFINIVSIVFDLVSVLYVSHMNDYIVVFVNDGRGFIFSTLPPNSCRPFRPLLGESTLFSAFKIINDIYYYPTILFYQQRYRTRQP